MKISIRLIQLSLAVVCAIVAACSPKVTEKNSVGCVDSGCHGQTESMHPWRVITCVECHGGDAQTLDKDLAHVTRPSNFGPFPLGAGTHIDNESFLRGPMMSHDLSDPAILAFRQFLNPGDMHVVDKTCGKAGECHAALTPKVTNSLHGTNAGLVSGVLYINGLRGHFADSDGSENDKSAFIAAHLPKGEPLVDEEFDPRIPGTVDSITTSPPLDDAAARDPATATIDGEFIKNMWVSFINDDCERCHIWSEGIKRPGDFRSSGCSACHVYYRNDGLSVSADIAISKTETDHPATHTMQRFPSDEQCSHCHSRGARHGLEFMGIRERPQGWRDAIFNDHGENDSRSNDPDVAGGRTGGFFPDNPLFLLAKAAANALAIPRDGDLMHGREYEGKKIWGRDTGRDDGNNYLIRDEDSTNIVDETPPDIHQARGMGCVDCHTSNEAHGDGRLYTDRYHEMEIDCESCHGTPTHESDLATRKGVSVLGLFRGDDGEVYQKLKSNGEVRRVMQVKRVVTNDGNQDYNANAVDGCGRHVTYDDEGRAVDDKNRLECASCHSTWSLNCSSCHMILDNGNDPTVRKDFATSLLDNVTRPGLQVQERFATSHDQLVLGMNQRGRINAFTMSGQAAQYGVSETGAQDADGNFKRENFVADPGFAAGITTNERVSNWLLTTVDGNKHLPAMPFNSVAPHTTQAIPRNCEACHPKNGANQHELERVDKAVGIGNGLRRSGGDMSQRISTIWVFADADAPDLVNVANPYNYDSGPLRDLVFNYKEIQIRRDNLRLFTGDSGDQLDATGYDGVPWKNGDVININIDEFIDYEFRVDGQVHSTRDTIPTLGPGIEVLSVEKKRPTTHIGAGPLDVKAINAMLQNEVDPQVRKAE